MAAKRKTTGKSNRPGKKTPLRSLKRKRTFLTDEELRQVKGGTVKTTLS